MPCLWQRTYGKPLSREQIKNEGVYNKISVRLCFLVDGGAAGYENEEDPYVDTGDFLRGSGRSKSV